MPTESSKDTEHVVPGISETLSKLNMRMNIITCQMDRCQREPNYLKEILAVGFEGVCNMNDRELFRYAMMHGLIDEDAGEER